MSLFSVLVVLAVLALVSQVVGAVLVWLGHRGEHWWDPSRNLDQGRNARLETGSRVALSCGVLLMLPWTDDLTSPPRWRLVLGLCAALAGLAGLLICLWRGSGLPAAQWAPDPTGETELEWYWNGRAWTDRRREPRLRRVN